MIIEGFGGCLPAEGLAGPAVEGDGDRFDGVRVPAGEVGAFREVLPQQPVVFSFVPRCQGLCGSAK